MADAPQEPETSAAPDGAPLVYISYSHRDQNWLDELLVWLAPMETEGLIRIFYDGRLKPGTDWDGALQSNLKNASVGIVLLSPDWIASDYGINRELPVLATRRVIPLLVRDCDWKRLPEISRRQVVWSDGKPLSAVPRPKQDEAFHSLVLAIRSLIGTPSGPMFSSEARQILNLAGQFAGSRPESRQIDTPCLVYALLERGRHEPTPVKTPQFLWNAIPEGRYIFLRSQHFPQFPGKGEGEVALLPGLQVIDNAAALSSNTLAQGRIHARHLLAALLIDPAAKPVLVELNLDIAAFRTAFLKFVFDAFPQEPEDFWTSFIAEKPERDEPEKVAVDASRGIARYQSEEWNGRDLLGIRRDVNALAALAAGWNVQPPLSIGLFGEWGSGKSFFMRQMRSRVNQLALAAQKSAKPQRECAYYKNIAQIEFNAWHYMEGDNLWACLVEHIFSNLALPQDTPEEIENRQKHILEQIGAKKALELQAVERKKELESKRDEAQKKASDARTELDAKGIALEKEKTALWGKIKAQLSGEVENVLRTIPEAAKLGDSVDALRKFSQDTKTLGGRVSLFGNLVRHDPQRRKMLYWTVGGSAATFALVHVAYFADPKITLLIRPAFQTLVPIATGLAAAAGRFRPALQKIGQVVAFFEEKNQEITEVVAKAEKAQQDQIAKLEGESATLSESITQAEKAEQEYKEAIVTLERELAATDANRLLAEFIKSRADADDYRKHLGIVALVRRDFERLSDFFRKQRADEEQGKERLDNNTVNRIILYIDDLDRCTPQTVVNVLQAIHLLLAFPIFVVVVAVDSRWVSRSLERCYDWLIPGTPAAAVPRPEPNGIEWPYAGPAATAHDYLEKIFQIPFWLAPMKGEACKSMIRGLAQAASAEQSRLRDSIDRAKAQPPANAPGGAASADGKTTTAPETVQPVSPAPPSEAGRDSVPASPPPAVHAPAETAGPHAPGETEETEVIDLAPRQLDVEEPELKKIDELADLIGRSPRVAKRFLNCYRLLKARMEETELREFLGGRFRDVMEVLAIVVGAPSIAIVVLNTLSTSSPGRQGAALTKQLTEALGAAAVSTAEGVEIMKLLGTASADHLKSLRGVAALVSRFSFETQNDIVAKPPTVPRKKASTAAS